MPYLKQRELRGYYKISTSDFIFGIESNHRGQHWFDKS